MDREAEEEGRMVDGDGCSLRRKAMAAWGKRSRAPRKGDKPLLESLPSCVSLYNFRKGAGSPTMVKDPASAEITFSEEPKNRSRARENWPLYMAKVGFASYVPPKTIYARRPDKSRPRPWR
jgi:hypothetical protein